MTPDIRSPRARIMDDVRRIASRHGVDLSAVMSEVRSRRVVSARQAAIFMVRQKYGLSLPHIGRIFGRDHSTVWHALARFRENEGHLDDPSVQTLQRRRARQSLEGKMR